MRMFNKYFAKLVPAVYNGLGDVLRFVGEQKGDLEVQAVGLALQDPDVQSLALEVALQGHCFALTSLQRKQNVVLVEGLVDSMVKTAENWVQYMKSEKYDDQTGCYPDEAGF